MNRRLQTIAVIALALLCSPSCIFMVDTEQEQDSTNALQDVGTDTQPTDAADADERDTDIEEDTQVEDDADASIEYSVTVTGPDDLVEVAPEDEFVLDYDIECEPFGCDTDLQCRIITGDDEPDFTPCSSPLSVTDDEVSEGHHTVEAAVLDDSQQILAQDSHTTTIRYLFDLSVEELSNEEPNTFYHPLLGEFDVQCSHPQCELDCRWQDGPSDIECPLDEPFVLHTYNDTGTSFVLVVEACSPVEFDGDPNCVEETYEFEYADPVWQDVQAGFLRTCALLEDHSLWCWGYNDIGQLGIGPDGDDIEALPQLVTFEDERPAYWKDFAIGLATACAIDLEGDLYCWGNNESGTVVPASEQEIYDRPTLLDDVHDWDSVAAGLGFSCALTTSGDLYCWGSNLFQKLGVGDEADEEGLNNVEMPVGVQEGTDPLRWLSVELGDHHGCGLIEQETPPSPLIGCWGKADDGQLSLVGPEADDVYSPPVLLPHDSPDDIVLDHISSGAFHGCVVISTDEESETYCWGNADHGRLGIGYSSPTPTEPTFVVDSHGFSQISAGFRHTCALDTDRYARCWGDNEFLQLAAVSSGEIFDEPQRVDFHDFDDDNQLPLYTISAGRQHTCALSDDQTIIYCWGTGESGALGTGDTEDAPTPIVVHWPHLR